MMDPPEKPMTFEELGDTVRGLKSRANLAADDHSLQLGVLNDTRDMVGMLGIAVVILFFMGLGTLVTLGYVLHKLSN